MEKSSGVLAEATLDQPTDGQTYKMNRGVYVIPRWSQTHVRVYPRPEVHRLLSNNR